MDNLNKNKMDKSILRLVFKIFYELLVFFLINNFTAHISLGNIYLKDIYFSSVLMSPLHILLCGACIISINFLMGFYRSLWEYPNSHQLSCTITISLLESASLFIIDYVIFTRIMHINAVLPYYAYFINAFMMFVIMNTPKMIYSFTNRIINKSQNRHLLRTLIIGAGYTGNCIIDDLERSGYKLGIPIIALDDNPKKLGKRVNGIKIVGTCNQMAYFADKYNIDQIVIAIPSLDSRHKKELLSMAVATGKTVKLTPSAVNLLDNKAQHMDNIRIEDLLLRQEITLDTKVCCYLHKNTVLVTGGGGSIGSELCKQVARYSPTDIIIFDIYENCAFELLNDLKALYGSSINIYVRIGSVRDIDRLREVFEEFHPAVVFHAAAHKHVSLMEDSPCEAVKNNVFGTLNVARIADEFNVDRMVILSTDKAVNPTNVMGATKRITELTIQYMNRQSTSTIYTAVRFGNVLGSHGSVIPIFEKQIANGGPVCVTHPDITRYFMTIPEAAQLVCQAGGLAQGGEIFVLDMGEPVKIMDLAKNLIKLSGYDESEIEIKITGLRPGEKLYEELALESEMSSRERTANEKIFITYPLPIEDAEIESIFEDLKTVNNNTIREVLKKHLESYHPKENM